MKMEDYLLSNQIIINNALNNADILKALALYGYNGEKIKAGKKILDRALELFNKQKIEYSEQYEATSELKKAFDAARKEYHKTLAVARVAYVNDVKAQNALMLSGERKFSYAGWLVQAEAFYDNVAAITPKGAGIFQFGYTEEKLKAEKALVEKVKQALLIQKKEMGEAQDATVERDEKLDELDDWMDAFVKIAKIALSDSPQLLEIMGIKA